MVPHQTTAGDVGEAQPQGFGGLALGALQLALPMAAIREVVPCNGLVPLPCPAACVIGGLDLRGTLLPVVDLRVLLARPCEPIAFPCIVVMTHDGRWLGLLAEAVTGVFEAVPGSLRRMQVADPTAAIVAGSVQRADSSEPVSLLSTAALAALPQVPTVEAPTGPAGSAVAHNEPGQPAEAAEGALVPIMLMRCGPQTLALPAMLVRATIANPPIQTSPLTRGSCLGTIAYSGFQVPAIDLLDLCGMGVLDRSTTTQAFVVTLPAGHVAFIVSEVIDVVRAPATGVMPVPRFALARPALFTGALPMSRLPADLAERVGTSVRQFLLLDGDALQSCSEVLCLAVVNTKSEDAVESDRSAFTATPEHGVAGGRPMVIYQLDGDRASPLEQIAEILNFDLDLDADAALLGDGLLGFIVNRDRSIPVLCLGALSGVPPAALAPRKHVLVVEALGDRVGFAVAALKNIEPARWEPELPDHRTAAPQAASGMTNKRGLALVGTGAAKRMLPVMDLRRLVRELQARHEMAAIA